ncbi:MAG: hypothetical protein LIO62_00590 [Clostridiales bacterium]|nr:hypothetical protein [Clostridiales bacterium]
MDKIDDYLADCMYYTAKLEDKMQESRDYVPNCMKGEILDEYLKTCDLAETRISKINSELHKLQEHLESLELQSLV